MAQNQFFKGRVPQRHPAAGAAIAVVPSAVPGPVPTGHVPPGHHLLPAWSPRMMLALHLGFAAAAADLERTALIDLALATNVSGWARHGVEGVAPADT